MKDIIVKLRQAAGPLALGWLLTVWVPVPVQVSATVNTAVNAVRNGVHAMLYTVEHKEQDQAALARNNRRG
jgi:hypothetical protein